MTRKHTLLESRLPEKAGLVGVGLRCARGIFSQEGIKCIAE